MALLRESAAIQDAAARAAHQIVAVAELIASSQQSNVVVSGTGKSGHIARKIAGTLASIGVPAFFITPNDMLHGELGVLNCQSVLVLISRSGMGDQLELVASSAIGLNVKTIGVFGDPAAPLASQVDIFVDASFSAEADDHGYLPTTSAIVALALGDALAVTLMAIKGFSPSDFLRTHPEGALGRRIGQVVRDWMVPRELVAQVGTSTLVKDAALELDRFRTGVAAVLAGDDELVGIVSDGDLRRVLSRDDGLETLTVGAVMATAPRSIQTECSLLEAQNAMRPLTGLPVSVLVVLEGARWVGVLPLNRLYEATRGDSDQ